jgi:hypothetical protein
LTSNHRRKARRADHQSVAVVTGTHERTEALVVATCYGTMWTKALFLANAMRDSCGSAWVNQKPTLIA